jgi:hypothetical protein
MIDFLYKIFIDLNSDIFMNIIIMLIFNLLINQI